MRVATAGVVNRDAGGVAVRADVAAIPEEITALEVIANQIVQYVGSVVERVSMAGVGDAMAVRRKLRRRQRVTFRAAHRTEIYRIAAKVR